MEWYFKRVNLSQSLKEGTKVLLIFGKKSLAHTKKKKPKTLAFGHELLSGLPQAS